MGDIAVIGGGASGIAAAIQAAESGARVTVLEAGKRIGHSILVSGNGRCNFSNSLVVPDAYTNAPFVAQAFGACPPQRVWDWFRDRGLRVLEEGGGRMYPLANKASSVLDVLRFALEEAGVQVECETRVARLRAAGGAWELQAEGARPRRFDAAVVSCGGSIARGMLPDGYRFEKRRGRLCPLQTESDALRGLDNVRARARVAVLREGGELASERGEVQFRSFGVSGVAAFNLSRFARTGDALRIDFLPDDAEGSVRAELIARALRFPDRCIEQLLAGMVLPAVARAVARKAGLDFASRLRDDGDAMRLARVLKGFDVQVRGFEEKAAQVRRGGVAVDQIVPSTMESRLDGGLFVTGEALDVDGPCGGFNLHWAWTSGLLAGAAAAGRR